MPCSHCTIYTRAGATCAAGRGERGITKEDEDAAKGQGGGASESGWPGVNARCGVTVGGACVLLHSSYCAQFQRNAPIGQVGWVCKIAARTLNIRGIKNIGFSLDFAAALFKRERKSE